MRINRIRIMALVAGLGIALGGAGGVQAEEPNAILDLLESKGLITHEEAVKAQLYYEQQQAAAVAKYDQPKFGDWLDKVGFYGDARVRFEWRSGEAQSGTDNRDRDRWRFRVRLGLEGEYQDNFFYGLRLETSSSPRSTNVTFGDKATANGPYSKSNNSIAIGRIYGGWKANDHFTLILGRQAVPFENTCLVWDDDLNPEGAVEKLSFKTAKVDWFANFGQFIYADFNENNFGGGGMGDVWMFGWQAGVKVKPSKDVSVTVAPTVYHYVSPKNFTMGTLYVGNGGNGGTNNIAINDLVVFDVPVSVGFKVGEIPAKVFGDFAINLYGSDRAKAAGDTAHDDQVFAYQVGAQLGAGKKKKEWSLKAFWQHTELYSLDPNLVDSDLFDSRLNVEGFVVQGVYCFTDFLSGKVTYAHATDIESSLPTLTGTGDLGSDLGKYDLLQADLNWKF